MIKEPQISFASWKPWHSRNTTATHDPFDPPPDFDVSGIYLWAHFKNVRQKTVDSEQDISGYHKQTGGRDFGRLVLKNGQIDELQLRDVCNKIIHASGLTWDFSHEADPVLICHSQNQEKWVRAEVDLFALAGFCGGIMS